MERKFTLEEMFGENYLEIIHQSMIDELFLSENMKKRFYQVCEAIDASSITDVELVKMLYVLPYEITVTIFEELKNRDSDELISLYDSFIYDQFIRDSIKMDKMGITNFEKRFIKQSENKALKERLLTRYEVETLIHIVSKKEGLGSASYDVTHYSYLGGNRYLKLLIKANKRLVTLNNYPSHNKIFESIKQTLLNWVLDDLKKYEHEIDEI